MFLTNLKMKKTDVINLTKGFNPFGEDEPGKVQVFTFAGGEIHIKLGRLNLKNTILLTARVTNAIEFMKIPVAVDAVRRSAPDAKVQLFIPYFPAARQDRVCEEGESLACKVYADIINNCSLDKVFIFDPHSDVVGALLNNAEIIDNSRLVHDAVFDNTYVDTLIIPDAGASKKAHKITGNFKHVVQADKVRDTKTGKLTNFKIFGDVLGKHCMIVDDICDGGGTFIGLAGLLKESGSASLHLTVSHGIFSRSLEPLKIFDSITTTESWCDESTQVVPAGMKFKVAKFTTLLGLDS